MSLASFFPDPLPSNPLQLMSLLAKAQEQHGNSEYVAGGERYWRISARLRTDSDTSELEAIADLKQLMAGEPVVFTGIDPLLDGAQSEIFDGFWKSLSLAFVIISVVMMIALRSLKLGAVAMIPNLTPIFLVFGMIGWLGISVDIGMMMSGSIALGIAVDGTFHFLVRYNERKKAMATSAEASQFALSHTGPAILQATLIAAVGMLAMTLSSFGPTARFGLLMAIMLMAALVGDLVLLPALLSLRGRVTRIAPPRPNIAMRSRQRSNRRAG
jgi:predicted RND superfamily exporter protein